MDAYQAWRLSELCHLHEKKVPHQSVSPEITAELGSSIFIIILQAFPDSVTALSMKSEAVNGTSDAQQIDPSDSQKRDFDSTVREFIDSVWFLEDDQQTLMELNARSQEEIPFFYSFIHVDTADSFELYNKTKFEKVEWKAQRQVRITGTTSIQLYTFMKGKQVDWDPKLRSVIFPQFAGNANTKYGRNCEKKAAQVLQKRYSSNQSTFTDEVGFIVNIRVPWLRFSPVGFIIAGTQVTLVEIKSPVKGKTMSGTELCQNLSYLHEVSPHKFVLKKKKKKKSVLHPHSVGFNDL